MYFAPHHAAHPYSVCVSMQSDSGSADERGRDRFLLHSAKAEAQGEDGSSQVRSRGQTTRALCGTEKEIALC